MIDSMPSSDTLIHVPLTTSTLAGSSVPLVVSSGTFHATGAGLLSLFQSSVFASASLTALRTSTQNDLFEICNTALAKLPRLWSRVRRLLPLNETVYLTEDIYLCPKVGGYTHTHTYLCKCSSLLNVP